MYLYVPVCIGCECACMQACFEGFVDCLCLIRCDIAIHKDVPASDSLCMILPIDDACNYVHHLNY